MASSSKFRFIYLCTSNVCRSPLAHAIASETIASNHLEDKIDVCSRGLTDNYSSWGSPAEPRMILAAQNLKVSERILDILRDHQSALLTKSEVLDPSVFIFLVTSYHEDWVRQAVGNDAVDAAKEQGRLRLISQSNENIEDPFFGEQEHYDEVCQILLEETPKSLKEVLIEGF